MKARIRAFGPPAPDLSEVEGLRKQGAGLVAIARVSAISIRNLVVSARPMPFTLRWPSVGRMQRSHARRSRSALGSLVLDLGLLLIRWSASIAIVGAARRLRGSHLIRGCRVGRLPPAMPPSSIPNPEGFLLGRSSPEAHAEAFRRLVSPPRVKGVRFSGASHLAATEGGPKISTS